MAEYVCECSWMKYGNLVGLDMREDLGKDCWNVTEREKVRERSGNGFAFSIRTAPFTNVSIILCHIMHLHCKLLNIFAERFHPSFIHFLCASGTELFKDPQRSPNGTVCIEPKPAH